MTRIKLYRPVSIAEKFYAKGEHEIDDVILKHWLIAAMIKDGTAIILADSHPPAEKADAKPKPEKKPRAKKPTAPAEKAEKAPESDAPTDPVNEGDQKESDTNGEV